MQDLLDGAILRAEMMTGYERAEFNQAIINAVMADVEAKFSGSDDTEVVILLRQQSKRPML
jgi:hypothetical protein